MKLDIPDKLKGLPKQMLEKILEQRIQKIGHHKPIPVENISVDVLKRLVCLMESKKQPVATKNMIVGNNPEILYTYFPIMCDWLFTLHCELFKITPYTSLHAEKSHFGIIHETMWYVFKVLSKTTNFPSHELQLLGGASYYFVIHKKFQNIITPDKICWYTNRAYTVQEMDKMIEVVGKEECRFATSWSLLQDLIKIFNPSDYVRVLSQYMIDATCHSILLVSNNPLNIAVSALILAYIIEGSNSDIQFKIMQFATIKKGTLLKLIHIMNRVRIIINRYESHGEYNRYIIPPDNCVCSYYRHVMLSLVSKKKNPIKNKLFED